MLAWCLLSLFDRHPDGIYRARSLDSLDWVEHGFGSRHSGCWNANHPTATLRQIHSDIVVRVLNGAGHAGRGDAMFTNRMGLRLAIRTADCLPILIADPVRRVVAAVHAGWRGAALAIASKTIAVMAAECGSDPGDLIAAIGPGIGGCCYEVGPEVAVRFSAWFPELGDATSPVRIDLAEAIRRQLGAAGVPPGRILAAGLCTRCNHEEFHSYRRDGDRAGRMVSSIGIR
ncbi:MAG: peptidoglycan editing factor PgeF [Acidobacteria bacterium]|nr:peptidoglycan editing factor PgeF [Acidobacteriota bacterium]